MLVSNYDFIPKEEEFEPYRQIVKSYCNKKEEELDEELEIIPAIKFPNGDMYFGNTSNNQPHGIGKIIATIGLEISGQWDNGQLYGRITIIDWSYRRSLRKLTIVDFSSGKFEVEQDIKILFPNGDLYYGKGQEYADYQFQPHGKGELLYSTGLKHTGNWKEGKLNGEGELRFKNGNIIQASWLNGKIDKHISFSFPNSIKFFGPFNIYGPHGYGKMELKDRVVWAEWVDGRLIRVVKIEEKQSRELQDSQEITLLYHERVYKVGNGAIYEEIWSDETGFVKKRKIKDLNIYERKEYLKKNEEEDSQFIDDIIWRDWEKFIN